MTYRNLALTSVFAVTFAGLAGAQEEGERYEFDQLDTNADGVVSLEELQAMIDTGVDSDANPQAIIEVQDANGDGVISRDEAGADDAIYTLEPTEAADEED